MVPRWRPGGAALCFWAAILHAFVGRSSCAGGVALQQARSSGPRNSAISAIAATAALGSHETEAASQAVEGVNAAVDVALRSAQKLHNAAALGHNAGTALRIGKLQMTVHELAAADRLSSLASSKSARAGRRLWGPDDPDTVELRRKADEHQQGKEKKAEQEALAKKAAEQQAEDERIQRETTAEYEKNGFAEHANKMEEKIKKQKLAKQKAKEEAAAKEAAKKAEEAEAAKKAEEAEAEEREAKVEAEKQAKKKADAAAAAAAKKKSDQSAADEKKDIAVKEAAHKAEEENAVKEKAKEEVAHKAEAETKTNETAHVNEADEKSEEAKDAVHSEVGADGREMHDEYKTDEEQNAREKRALKERRAEMGGQMRNKADSQDNESVRRKDGKQARLRKAFRQLDADGDGELTTYEAAAAGISDADLESLDADGNGKLDRDEFGDIDKKDNCIFKNGDQDAELRSKIDCENRPSCTWRDDGHGSSYCAAAREEQPPAAPRSRELRSAASSQHRPTSSLVLAMVVATSSWALFTAVGTSHGGG